MHTKFELDVKVEETLKISHDLGFRDGAWAAFIAVHEMLQSHGYRDLLPKVRQLSRDIGAPINEYGEEYEGAEMDSADVVWANDEDHERSFATVTVRGVEYVHSKSGWKVMDYGWKEGTYDEVSYPTNAEAQAAADAFLAKKQAE